jgi:hypothetical protein
VCPVSKETQCRGKRDLLGSKRYLVLLAFLAARGGVLVRSATIPCVLRIFLPAFGDSGARATLRYALVSKETYIRGKRGLQYLAYLCLAICTSCVDG